MYSIVICNQFVFQCFVLIRVFDFSKPSVTFGNTYLLSCWFHCVVIFDMEFKFFENVTVINSVTITLITEILYKFRTIRYCFTFCIYTYIFFFNFQLSFKIVIKTSETCTLFGPIRLQIFYILTIMTHILLFPHIFLLNYYAYAYVRNCKIWGNDKMILCLANISKNCHTRYVLLALKTFIWVLFFAIKYT